MQRAEGGGGNSESPLASPEYRRRERGTASLSAAAARTTRSPSQESRTVRSIERNRSEHYLAANLTLAAAAANIAHWRLQCAASLSAAARRRRGSESVNGRGPGPGFNITQFPPSGRLGP